MNANKAAVTRRGAPLTLIGEMVREGRPAPDFECWIMSLRRLSCRLTGARSASFRRYPRWILPYVTWKRASSTEWPQT